MPLINMICCQNKVLIIRKWLDEISIMASCHKPFYILLLPLHYQSIMFPNYPDRTSKLSFAHDTVIISVYQNNCDGYGTQIDSRSLF